MKGILLLSHGNMAEGMLQSTSIFFGEDIPQLKALGYQLTDDSDAFEEEIGRAIQDVDSGDGVLVLTDLFAGTPAHKTTKYLQPGKVDVICGMNFPLLLELLGMRDGGDPELEHLLAVGKEGLRLWAVETQAGEDDFY